MPKPSRVRTNTAESSEKQKEKLHWRNCERQRKQGHCEVKGGTQKTQNWVFFPRHFSLFPGISQGKLASEAYRAIGGIA